MTKPVSNCCSAPFIIGFIEDGERCAACKEHCGVEESPCDELKSIVHNNQIIARIRGRELVFNSQSELIEYIRGLKEVHIRHFGELDDKL